MVLSGCTDSRNQACSSLSFRNCESLSGQSQTNRKVTRSVRRSSEKRKPTMQINPEMIVLARDLLGARQHELADALSRNQATVSRYESGQIAVPPEHLKAIAEILHRPVSFFYCDERLYRASCMYHRKNRRISASEMRAIDAKVNLLRMQAARLLTHAKVTSNYSFHRLDAARHSEPEVCAQELPRIRH